jgi:hypothetical protein
LQLHQQVGLHLLKVLGLLLVNVDILLGLLCQGVLVSLSIGSLLLEPLGFAEVACCQLHLDLLGTEVILLMVFFSELLDLLLLPLLLLLVLLHLPLLGLVHRVLLQSDLFLQLKPRLHFVACGGISLLPHHLFLDFLHEKFVVGIFSLHDLLCFLAGFHNLLPGPCQFLLEHPDSIP